MKKVLVLTDFSRRAARAAEFALEIAAREGDEVLLFYSCYMPMTVSEVGAMAMPAYAELEKDNREELTALAERLQKKFFKKHRRHAPGIMVETLGGTLGLSVREVCRRNDVRIIVMGGKSRENGFERFLFGSETREVIGAAPCPVLLVPEGAVIERIGKIGFATELNRSDPKVMPFLAEFAGLWKSSLELVHVENKAEINPGAQKNNNQVYSRMLRASDYPDTHVVTLDGEDIGTALDEYAKHAQPDVLALVHRKRSFFRRALHRSVSRQMIEANRTPVLVMPEPQ